MRIAFCGLPLAAILLARDGHEIVWAGVCRSDAAGVRRLRALIGRERVAMVPDLETAAEGVRSLAPELVVSWFWTKKMPRAFRTLAPLGAVGVHPSLLPRHRGPDPYFWAIDAGDDRTGVTAHALEDEYDTGAILGQRELAIDPSWNAWTLAKKLDRPSLALLRETVGRYARGDAPRGVPQDEARATLAPPPTDDELELRWTDDTEAVVRRVRAASPWPGAFTAIADEVLVLTEVRRTDAYPRVLAPGQAFVRADGVAVIRTADGAVELLRGRFDDQDEELDARALREIVEAARESEG